MLYERIFFDVALLFVAAKNPKIHFGGLHCVRKFSLVLLFSCQKRGGVFSHHSHASSAKGQVDQTSFVLLMAVDVSV